jgi:uncharacterized protein YbaA (DUF1428 family)
MTKYVDGFVLVVPKKKLAIYKKMAIEGSKTWRKFGAIDYKECVGDDLHIKGGGGMPAPLSFAKLAKVKKSETVWFSYITYKSRAHRDSVNKRVHAYFMKKYAHKKDEPMPFDMKRMAYGGFKVVVSR